MFTINTASIFPSLLLPAGTLSVMVSILKQHMLMFVLHYRSSRSLLPIVLAHYRRNAHFSFPFIRVCAPLISSAYFAPCGRLSATTRLLMKCRTFQLPIPTPLNWVSNSMRGPIELPWNYFLKVCEFSNKAAVSTRPSCHLSLVTCHFLSK